MRRAVEFEWDERKARANLRKHRVDFADAATVFEDDRALTVANDDPEKEHYVTIGMDALGRVLVVVYTMRGERIRIISARQATSASARSTSKVYETRIRFQQGQARCDRTARTGQDQDHNPAGQ